MFAWSKSRRLRRQALLRWALLVLPMAFLLSRIGSVDGLSTLVLFWTIVCVALLPFLLIHIFLGWRNKRRNRSRATSPIVLSSKSVMSEVLKADTKTRAKTDGKTGAKVDASAVSKVGAPPETNSAAKKGANTKTPSIDLDATAIGPEDLQLQVEGVADVVQTCDLGGDDLMCMDEESSTLVDRAQPDQSSVAGTSLIIATSHADTAELSALTQTETTQLVATLQKDKTRLHRLVIAQQVAIDSERKAHDRSRLVARDAIKIMRDSREGQKRAEKLARREHSERKRLEVEYRKVSTALDNAKSILASRDNETV